MTGVGSWDTCVSKNCLYLQNYSGSTHLDVCVKHNLHQCHLPDLPHKVFKICYFCRWNFSLLLILFWIGYFKGMQMMAWSFMANWIWDSTTSCTGWALMQLEKSTLDFKIFNFTKRLNAGWVWLLHSNHDSPLPGDRHPPWRISPRIQRGKGETFQIRPSSPNSTYLQLDFDKFNFSFCTWPLTRCAFFTPLPILTTLEAQKLGQPQGRTRQASSYSSMSAEASSCSSMSSISPSKWKGSCQGSAQGGKRPALATTRGTFSTSRPQWSLHWPGASFLCSARLLCSPMHTWRNKSARAMFSTLTPFCGFSFPTCSTPTSTWGWKAEEFHQSPKSQDRPTFPICQKTTWLWKEEGLLLTTATREGRHIQESRHCQSGGWICQPWHIKLQRKGVQRQEFLKGSQRSRKGCHGSFPTFPNSKRVKNQKLLPTSGGKKRRLRYGTKRWTTRRRDSCFIPDIWML